jgi:hypothetical protein
MKGELGIMEGTGITPVMDVNHGYGYGDGFGGNGSFVWLFAILALMWGGNGFFGGNGNSNAVQADVNRGFDNQNLQAQTRDILSAVTNGTAQAIAASTANATNAINAIKDGNASLIREFGNVETALTALGGNLQNCCCSIQRNIDQTNYNMAQNTALINATTTAQTQKILDALAQNKIDALQNKVNQLELQNAVAGVVRYPTSTTYTSGGNPFCGCGCGCNGNI